MSALATRSLACLALAGALALLWIPLAPDRLFDFDAANFGLSLDYYNPAMHQPQPPGYPLFVAVSWLIHLIVRDAARSFLIAGILAASSAAVMLAALGSRMYRPLAGIVAAGLFLSNPIVWKSAMTDQVRVYLAVISIAVAFAAWPAWESTNRRNDFLAACLVLGMLAGFRPETLVSLTPLLALVALKQRLSISAWFAGALAVCAGAAPWLAVLIRSMGGPGKFWIIMRSYATAQAGASSVVLGAESSAALRMFEDGIKWASLGLIAWIPLALAIRWWKPRSLPTPWLGFVLAWFVPQFLFSVAIHIAAPGHALSFIPALCLAGGWLFAGALETNGRFVAIPCALVAIGLNLWLFFEPYSPKTSEASYSDISRFASINTATLDGIDTYRKKGPVTLVHYDGSVVWRTLQYYYPTTPYFYLPGAAESNNPLADIWWIQSRRVIHEYKPATEVELPSCVTTLWILNDEAIRRALLAMPHAIDERYFVALPTPAGERYSIGRYRLRASSRTCGASR